ncbi:MAG: hypothetical protein RL607_2277 [Bacteroidota bacterium]|jgi:hypothetical protein
MKKIFLSAFALASFWGYSQTTPAAPAEKEWDVNLYGFVRTDYIFDTRKSANVRENELNLYPLDEIKDANGVDLNANSASNFLSIVSRFGVKAKGPNVWGAKISGNLEGDFFGNSESAATGSSIGLLRLRHAYVNMEWSKTTLTMGQTWYPTFIPEVFPGVANFNTGIMFNPFGWATQVRLKQNLGKNFSFALTAYKEREFTVSGPGTQNAASINSPLPTLHGQFQFKNKSWIAGLGLEYKSLQPLTEIGGKSTDEKINSTLVVGYFKYSNDKFSVKAYGISGGDMYSQVMLGGYAGYTSNGIEKYKASKTSAFWLDIASNGKSIAPGLFLGLTQNDGTDKNGLAAGETVKYYMRGVSGTRVVDNVMRVSGRVDFKQNKFRVTPEIEYTKATWGDLSSKANGEADTNSKDVSNIRFMVSCVYSF